MGSRKEQEKIEQLGGNGMKHREKLTGRYFKPLP
jgi:hypothetical protein